MVSSDQTVVQSRYGTAYIEALVYTATLHATQTRKSTDIPYLSHLMIVSAYVWEAGGDETAAIAALLHDAVEDQGGHATLVEIRERFGEAVAEIVKSCSDSMVSGDMEKAPWEQRKEQYISHLRDPHTSDASLLVGLADKLHNCQAIVQDVTHGGADVWRRFNAQANQIAWYYESILSVANERLPDNRITQRLNEWVPRLVQLAWATPAG